MATLRAIPQGEWIEFARLKAILQATDGNLGSHIATLEGAGYITVSKDFVGKKPRTLALTRGRKAFTQHIEFLRPFSTRLRRTTVKGDNVMIGSSMGAAHFAAAVALVLGAMKPQAKGTAFHRTIGAAMSSRW